MTPAQAAARRRAARASRPRQRKAARNRSKPLSLFQRGAFVAIDGEGFSEGEEHVWTVGDNEYRGRSHFYALLSSSDGSELYSDTGRLSTQDCLDYLLSLSRIYRGKAILVCFGASYDMTQMLCHGLDRDEVNWLLQGDGNPLRHKHLDVTLGDFDYRIACMPRKSLTVKRWPKGADKYERAKNGGWKLTKHDKATLWDVWGFFQDSFAGAMSKWIPDDPDYQFIKQMKGERSVFDRSEIDTIRRYNQAELRALVAMMERVRDAIAGMGLSISRWDGAGAIASAFMRANDVKHYMERTPDDVFTAARHAYSGGHIEMCQIGHYEGKVYHYDINSAYPHWFRQLPSLAGGTWLCGSDEVVPSGFTLVRVSFHFYAGLPFYPLFYRETNGAILYPDSGEGWYWYPEFSVARRFAAEFGAHRFQVMEWKHLKGSDTTKWSPFTWVADAFERRKHLVAEAKRTGIPSGEEKTLKLGYNSCYGKTAQQVGARLVEGELQPPSYFQLEWAGYVTAGCRSQIMEAAMQAPDAIIAMATDGIFSTRPLDLYTPAEKELGAWEAQVHDGITMVMPGVYWLHDGGKAEHHSRGFDKRQLREHDPILAAWRKRQSKMGVHMQRLVTLGTATTSDQFWEMRGMFVDCVKSLAINGDNSKREPINLSLRPERGLIQTRPRQRWPDLFDAEQSELSAIYPIDWLDYEGDDPLTDDERAFADDVSAAWFA